MKSATGNSFRHKLGLMGRAAATTVTYCAPTDSSNVGNNNNCSKSSGGFNWKIKTRLASYDNHVDFEEDNGKYNLLQTQILSVALNTFAGFLPFTIRWNDDEDEGRDGISYADGTVHHTSKMKVNKNRSASSNQSSSGVKWSIFTTLQLAVFVLAHGYGAFKVATEASTVILNSSSRIDLCVVTLGSCSVVGELCVLGGTLAFIYDAPHMKLLLEKMRAFPLKPLEFLKLRRANCRCMIAWLMAVVTIVGAINLIKYGMPSPVELRILADLANGVSSWPRWLGFFSVVLLDTLFLVVVQGVSKTFQAFNGDLEKLLPPEPLERSIIDPSRKNTIDDIFSPDTPKEVIDAVFGRKTKSRPEILEDLRLRYVGLCEIVSQVQGAFSHYLVVTIVNAGLNMTITLYLLLTHSVRAVEIGHVKLFLLTAAITGFSLVRIYAICVVASGPGNQVSKAQRILSKYSPMRSSESNNNSSFLQISESAIMKFHEELRIGMPLISAGGYFVVSRKLLLSIAATVDTYLIILLQFSISSEMGGDGFHHSSLACLYSSFNASQLTYD